MQRVRAEQLGWVGGAHVALKVGGVEGALEPLHGHAVLVAQELLVVPQQVAGAGEGASRDADGRRGLEVLVQRVRPRPIHLHRVLHPPGCSAVNARPHMTTGRTALFLVPAEVRVAISPIFRAHCTRHSGYLFGYDPVCSPAPTVERAVTFCVTALTPLEWDA